jgi:hypothetical protein
MTAVRWLAAGLGLLASVAAASAQPALGDRRLQLQGAALPVVATAEWNGGPVRRAVVVVHGLGRDAVGYFTALQRARAAAGVEAWLESCRPM